MSSFGGNNSENGSYGPIGLAAENSEPQSSVGPPGPAGPTGPQGPSGFSGLFIGARCRRDNPQIVGSSADVDVLFETLVYPDPADLVDFSFTAGANPFTIINGGIYVIAAGWALSGSTSGVYRDGRLIIDGLPAVPPHGNFDQKPPSGLFHTAHNLYTEMRLEAGYRIGAQCFQDSGGNLSIDIFADSPWLTLRRIR